MFFGRCKLTLKQTTKGNVAMGLLAATVAAMLALAAASGTLGHSLFGAAQAEEQSNLVVKRQSLDGASLNMWISVKSGDGTGAPLMASWHSPWSFAGAADTMYTVKAHNWSEGGIFFDHWEDGSTSATRQVMLEAGATTTLTAYYKTGAEEVEPVPAAVKPTAPVQARSEGTRATGVYVPLYKYPDLGNPSGLWSSVIDAKKAHPSVPFAVSVNPSNGPGSSADSRIRNAIGELRAAGVEHILGYVPTMYAQEPSGRTMGDLKGMVDKYRAWYPEMDGLMMDTMAANSDKVSFYKELVSYAKSKGFTFIKGNPGAKVDAAYIDIFDNVAIYERFGAPSVSTLESNTLHGMGFGKDKFAFAAKGVSGLDTGYLNEIRNYVAYVYMTNDGGGNPYNTVPPYFDSMVAALDS
jgi:hypothetical protein